MSSNTKTELITLRDFLRYAVSRFSATNIYFGHGTTNAFDEAVYLICHTLGLNSEHLEIFLDAKLLLQERELVLDILQKRVQNRIPAAYLTHEAWLFDYKFYVDERTIIPRSFIAELLINSSLEVWFVDNSKIQNVLDLCTGSGCLAIIAADIFANAAVDAIDISKNALAVAEKNIKNYALQNQINLLCGDGFEVLKNQQKKYDLIICNPPYVDAEAMKNLPAEYRHEPSLALASGIDGLDFVKKLLQNAKNYLSENGILVVEIGHQKEKLLQEFPELNFVWLETQAGNDYVFLLEAKDL